MTEWFLFLCFLEPSSKLLFQTKMLSLPRFRVAAFISLILINSSLKAESAIGVNWGTLSFHKLKPTTVVDLLKENKVQKVKLFDADPDALKALMGSGIQVMVGISNDMLATLSSSTMASDLWVRQNVSRYIVKGGVDIRFVYPSSASSSSSSSFFNVFFVWQRSRKVRKEIKFLDLMFLFTRINSIQQSTLVV